jgi:3',5'-cyclic AMP phosphodiesterase CpdA
MRLAITSDLHVDHHAEVAALLAAAITRLEADVLVVAGDLTADGALLERTLATLRPCAREAVFVPGNHDLWCKREGPDSRERYERIVPTHARNAGFHAPFVDAAPRLFGHRFAGVTGWYDYTLRSRAHDALVTAAHYDKGRYGPMSWNDKQHVIWPGDDGVPLDDPGICAAQTRALAAQLDAIGDEPVVVVTHHLPFFELVTERGDPRWDFLNGFMGSTRLGDAILRAPGVRLSISGHTHFRKDVRVGARPLRALTSPLGYPREYRRAGQTLAERVTERVTLVEL